MLGLTTGPADWAHLPLPDNLVSEGDSTTLWAKTGKGFSRQQSWMWGETDVRESLPQQPHLCHWAGVTQPPAAVPCAAPLRFLTLTFGFPLAVLCTWVVQSQGRQESCGQWGFELHGECERMCKTDSATELLFSEEGLFF